MIVTGCQHDEYGADDGDRVLDERGGAIAAERRRQLAAQRASAERADHRADDAGDRAGDERAAVRADRRAGRARR